MTVWNGCKKELLVTRISRVQLVCMMKCLETFTSDESINMDSRTMLVYIVVIRLVTTCGFQHEPICHFK
ncbi:hypothetical protein CRE_03311 [Caenorhabditis remanei]|uniref:Uncharacterized protein n=1 Tax=Caenorhabditis remanei TaxID=31234 RepID=E3MMK9_CAERE|nr:hypothetical protein CRE_03311 [Caenorhabditis remanei]